MPIGERCFAWALIPNHFHLLLKTGSLPIATVMGRTRIVNDRDGASPNYYTL
jgi:hypothetical protein